MNRNAYIKMFCERSAAEKLLPRSRLLANRKQKCVVGAPNPAATADVGLNGEWKYVDGTPTIRIYSKGRAVVVTLRGAASGVDLEACLSIVSHNLESQTRYEEDKKFILQFQSKYPPSDYVYLLTGHSLGGALSDQLMKDGIGVQAITFNPAVQKAFYKSMNHQRIYQSLDPLYRMMGRYCEYNVQVLTTYEPGLKQKVLSATGMLGSVLADAWGAHAIDSFVGSFKDKQASAPEQEQASDHQQEPEVSAVEDSFVTDDLVPSNDPEDTADIEGHADSADLQLSELYEDIGY
jgi:hypothetical protein